MTINMTKKKKKKILNFKCNLASHINKISDTAIELGSKNYFSGPGILL